MKLDLRSIRYPTVLCFFLIVSETEAVFLNGLVRLFRLDGTLTDSSIYEADLAPAPRDGITSGITFPYDTPYGPQPRKVISFAGLGRARGSAVGLPGGRSPRTIVGWFKRTGSTEGGPFGYGRDGCSNAYYVYISGSNLVDLDSWCQMDGINSIFTATNDEWYHLAITYDGSQNRAYLNGQFIVAGTPFLALTTTVDSSASTVLGGSVFRNDAAEGVFTGRVADFAIFNRALAPTEVLNIYQDPNGLQGGSLPPPAAPTASPKGVSQTFPPTTTQNDLNFWYIESSGNATHKLASRDIIEVSMPFIVNNRDHGALVFDGDCITPFNSDNYFDVDTTTPVLLPNNFITFNTTLEINVTALATSDYWNPFTNGGRGGWVLACVETYLNFTDTLGLNRVPEVKVDFKNILLNISASLTADFAVDNVDISKEESIFESLEIDYSEWIVAYECIEEDPYTPRSLSYRQGDEIVICVSDESPPPGIFQVDEFVDLVVSQPGISPYFFIKDSLWNPALTTTNCIDGDTEEYRRVCVAKIRALARFFPNNDPVDLTISGNILVYREGFRFRLRRNLRMTLPTPEMSNKVDGRRAEKDDEGSGAFTLQVSLLPESEPAPAPVSPHDDNAAPGRIVGITIASLISIIVGTAILMA